MKKIIAIIFVIALVAFVCCGVGFGLNYYKNFKAAEAEAESEATLSENNLTPVEENGELLAYSDTDTDGETATDTAVTDNDSAPLELDPNDQLYELKHSLVVDLDRVTLEKMYIDQLIDFHDNSMPNRRVERNSAAAKVGWGSDGDKMMDAVTFPFSTVSKGKTKYSQEEVDQMLHELEEEDDTNPIFLDMELQAAKEMKLTDNTSPYDYNKDWMDQYISLYDEYGPGAFIMYHTVYWQNHGFELCGTADETSWKAEHPDAPAPTEAEKELIVDEATGKPRIYTTTFHQETSKRWKNLRAGLTVVGVETHKTYNFWYLNDAQNANIVRTIHNKNKDYVDNYPSLMFAGEDKSLGRQFLFGYNIYDKRIIVPERTSKPVTKKSTTTQKQKKKDPTPTPTTQQPVPVITTEIIPVTPTPTPTPGPTPIPEYDKNPYDDPVHSGDAQKGGGEGQGETPAESIPDPSKNDMKDAGGGQDDNGGHSDPTTVTPETPKLEDNPSGGETTPAPKDDENKMDYGDEPAAKDNGGTENGNVPDEPAGGEFEM